MQQTIEIREGNLDDAYTIHLQIPEFEQSYQDDYFTQRVGVVPFVVLLGYLDGNPAGYIIAYDKYNDGSLYCWMAGVIPKYRKYGVLTSLMNELEKYAKENKYSSIKIKTRNSRREMLSFLVKNNFLFTSIEVHPQLEENRIHLVKPL